MTIKVIVLDICNGKHTDKDQCLDKDMTYACVHTNDPNNTTNNFITSNKLDAIMKHYYNIDQDNSEIRKLNLHTFPYLNKDDITLDMSDRSIVERELDLTTDSVLPDNEKHEMVNYFYCMRECLSTLDNSSVDCKTTVSLNPVNLKPFYIRPYLIHEKEIKFAEAEMENFAKWEYCIEDKVNSYHLLS